MDPLIKPGCKVRVKRGVFIQKGFNGYTSKRAVDVTVNRIERGITASPRTILYDDWYLGKFLNNGGDVAALERLREINPFAFNNMEVEVSPSSVVWAGSGGYWRSTKISNVEFVSQS